MFLKHSLETGEEVGTGRKDFGFLADEIRFGQER
jgi:hypothetical protein